MSTELIAVIIGSAFLHAAWNSIVKGGSDKLFDVGLVAAGAGVCALIVLFFLPLPAAESWPYIALSMCFHLLYQVLMAYSYKGADMSYAYTIMRGSAPLFTALVATLLLGDKLGSGGWAGVLLLSSGILILALDSVRHGGFRLRPTLSALCTSVMIMGYTIVDGGGARASGQAVSYACWIFFANLFPINAFAIWRGGRTKYFGYLRQRWRVALIGGLCSFLSYGLSVWAMAYAPVALVAALRETSVIFGMILAVLLLKEKFYLTRAISVLLVVAGAGAIKFFA